MSSGALLVVLMVACGAPATPGPTTGGSQPINVVTTSTVFADLVARVGGDRVRATSLVPKGTDVHTYHATPADLRAVTTADLFVMNGLGLDDWLEETKRSASSGAPILRLGPAAAPEVKLLPGESESTRNPHLWMDVASAGLYARSIADALAAADPAHAAEIAQTSTAYLRRLDDLEAWVRDQIATVPVEDRKIVLFHDALPYFARAYGLTIVGFAVEAPGQDPSAGEIAALVDAIRASGVKAIFSEDQFPTSLIDQIALETGARVVASLYTDSLGDDPVTSYEAMIRWDVTHIVEALR